MLQIPEPFEKHMSPSDIWWAHFSLSWYLIGCLSKNINKQKEKSK